MSLFLGATIYCLTSSVVHAQETEEATEKVSDTEVSLANLFQKEQWEVLDARVSDMKSGKVDEWLMGARAALELGALEKAQQRYKRASILSPKEGCPTECIILRERTARVTIRGEGTLLYTQDAPYYLLRAIDTANEQIAQEQLFSGRLPHGLYKFGDGGVLVSNTGAEVLTSEQLVQTKATQEAYENSFKGQVYAMFHRWKYTPTTMKTRAALHAHYFGSDNSQIAMQSVWSFGPTVGLVWTKTRDKWGVGAEVNGVLSFSSRSFLLGVHGNGFGEYALPKGFVRGGVRYDLSFGRIVGVQTREQIGTVTEEELDALAIPGVALSLGAWLGYRYPIRDGIDVEARVGFRHDGKRGYFDSDVGAILDFPF